MAANQLIIVSSTVPTDSGTADSPVARPTRFELPKARNFIEKSVSEDTRRAYTRALLDFFSFVNKPPAKVTVEDVIAYRDELIKKKRRKARTVNTKLSVVRAYFNYLKAAGDLSFNPADTKLVSVPQVPEDMAGRTLAPEEVMRLINAPDQNRTDGARDHALLLVLARTSLRVSEVRNLRLSSIVWSHGRWTARVRVKGGRERTIPLPKDIKQAIDHYLQLDAVRRQNLHCDGDDAFIFQPIVNYRTLEFDKPLSARQICQIVNRWADFAGLNQRVTKDNPNQPATKNKKSKKPRLKLSPHDLRRTAVTRALSLGFTYRQVQGMTGHKDIRMVVRYDHERGNIEENAINFLHYDND
ncbi:MAG TPA: tyrosine-type recombinase/integrase [Blastocatellia bacterium]|nr:tyrosine-type recombinase/integrase [Blastocatellia bacterium]